MKQSTTVTRRQMRDLLTELRAIAPQRGLSYGESLQVARMQAAHIRSWSKATTPDINLVWLLNQTEIPVESVASHVLHEESGLTTNAISGKVKMFVNQNEPLVRQRFSLLHEFKHAVDFADADMLHSRLGTGNSRTQATQIELICNEFAGHVLMPKAMVVRAWIRLHNLSLLASLFNVSNEAMQTRLEKLGVLGSPKPRPRSYFRTASGEFASGSEHLAVMLVRQISANSQSFGDEVAA